MSQANKKLSFIFFGTPDPAVFVLETLKENEFLPTLIVTAPDKPSGRGLVVHESPVAIWAKENNINVLKPDKLKDGVFVDKLSDIKPDIGLVFAYGKIIPENIISIPSHGTLNIHPSLLPKYRGPAPVEGALLAGEEKTGVTLMTVDAEMDHGPILEQEEVVIENNETAPELLMRLVKIGTGLFVRMVQSYISGEIKPKKQDHSNTTYTKKITKADGEISIDEPGDILWRKYRAYYGWPGIYFIKNNKRIKITNATFVDGEFKIQKVLPEGKKEMNYADYLRGNN